MKVIPLGKRVLIRQTKKEEKTAGGIYIPDSAKEEKKEGEVVAVGTYDDGKALPLSVGDHILYGGYSSEEIDLDGVKHLIVDFKDILAKIE